MLQYGYLLGEGGETKIITPPQLKGKIGLTPGNRFCLVGTRNAILEWLRNHYDTIVEANLGYKHEIEQDLVFDTYHQYNASASWTETFWNYVGWPDKNTEHVRVEIRIRNAKTDDGVEPYHRVLTPNKVTLGAMADTLEKQWASSGPSYVDIAKHLLNDEPLPAPYVDNLPLSGILVEETTPTTETAAEPEPLNTPDHKDNEVPYLA
ncbi:hypothetical protein K493DRAFT_405900 [Basidiobolus meristosporus CBS 931.73]|uniref:Uncharacterized protein n=1 Tax=Basidiobolus meristosporus CBS 931.73 TaxID=1314790 RepID=A0A1Y1YQT4_9FUNG|nr:hypothetical protein K493DRAFT_412764 [Basidiobolus meristosporus CBS 931.73]ORY00401.1 hypothetical protein K493DRAFT_405900 [Basidiobolus meristosporus CBS 931.73]|eukprot:ORX66103.1 hypothetical protein K493DRAFT_412764 [Basidiobolus meristosporus CBS 931.73]